MAYLALYRKYRPQSFDEVYGQKEVLKTLTNALTKGKIAHAYLFCGPRGTGKTTMARLFAKALNCEKGIGNECNECENCKSIMNGTHPDVYEVDAASNSGVDNVRQLIEQVNFQPILGRYKVYIIDEVHMMTQQAFNALLKTLEEPPAHVVFILATTEPNKVLPTILSRVQRYDFTKVANNELIALIKHVLECEKVDYDEEAVELIARLADGGCRDALSLLDQAISYSGDYLHKDDIYSLFGLLQVADKLELLKKIHNEDLKGVLEFSKEKYDQGADILKLHDDLINIYKDLLVFGTTRDESLLTYLKADEALGVLITPREIRRNLDLLIDERRGYKNVSNVFDKFELVLIKLTLPEEKPTYVEAPTKKQPVYAERKDLSETITVAPVRREIEVPVVKEEEHKDIIKIEPEVEEQAPVTIKTSQLVQPILPEDEDKIITIDEDMILNIMVQGDKNLKNMFLEEWDNLNNLPTSDDLYTMSSTLHQCQPRIACDSVLVVENVFPSATFKINNYNAQPELRAIMDRIFGRKINVIALTHSQYVDYVQRFKNLLQANNLPKPHEITLFDDLEVEDIDERTEAEKFIDSLN